MNKLLTCKRSAELMSQAMDHPLGTAERLKLRVHLLFCRGCRNVRLQLGFIRTACSAWLGRNE
jgi:hypothetical protein